MEKHGTDRPWTIHERMLAVLNGETPDRPPFIDRLLVWRNFHNRAGTTPDVYKGLSLDQVHLAAGMGRQHFMVPYALRLPGVELIADFEGEVFRHEQDPILQYFPLMADLAVVDRPGVTTIRLLCPAGEVSVQHAINPFMVEGCLDVYTRQHVIKDENDYKTVEYLIERAEFIPLYDSVRAVQEDIGDFGFVAPLVHRTPFQQMLLEYLGEMQLFYTMHDTPDRFQRMMKLLDEQLTQIFHQLANYDGLYLEFPDNLHSVMTNPRLFAEHCLPYYQRYSDILHAQGKKVGSHTDGDVKPLLGLLAESGLDVCESFSPAPLTSCKFEEAWRAWENGPIIWGGIPSPILEARTGENDFKQYVDHLLEQIQGRPIILGVGDMVMGNNLIERVSYIADQVEAMPAVS